MIPRLDGVDASDTPDEPAVDGRVSRPVSAADSRFCVGLLRDGTPSGHVHCGEIVFRYWTVWRRYDAYLALSVSTAQTVGLRLVALRTVSQFRLSYATDESTHLDLFRSTRQAARFAARILGALPLGSGHCVMSSGWGDNVHMAGAVRLGVI